MTKAPVAAGVDGSPAGRQRSVGRPQRLPPAVPDSGLVHAFVWPQFPVPLGPSDVAPSLRAAADKIVRESVELAQKLEPGVPVEGTREDGFPPKAIRSTANARPAAVVTRIGSRSPSGSITGAGRWRRCGAVRCGGRGRVPSPGLVSPIVWPQQHPLAGPVVTRGGAEGPVWPGPMPAACSCPRAEAGGAAVVAARAGRGGPSCPRTADGTARRTARHGGRRGRSAPGRGTSTGGGCRPRPGRWLLPP